MISKNKELFEFLVRKIKRVTPFQTYQVGKNWSLVIPSGGNWGTGTLTTADSLLIQANLDSILPGSSKTEDAHIVRPRNKQAFPSFCPTETPGSACEIQGFTAALRWTVRSQTHLSLSEYCAFKMNGRDLHVSTLSNKPHKQEWKRIQTAQLQLYHF